MPTSEPDTIVEPDPADAPAPAAGPAPAHDAEATPVDAPAPAHDAEMVPVDADAQAHDPALPDPEPAPATAAVPEVPASTATIEIAGHKIDVHVEDVPASAHEDTVAAIKDGDLDRLRQILAEDSARRGRVEDRPFEHVDTESLLVLAGKIRGELASR